MFTMSGIYHALEPGLGRQVFRRLDYAAIFVMIAGTATPIHVIMFRGWWRWGMLIYLWVVAIVGLLLTVILIDQIPEWATLSVFMAMGWTALASILKAGRLYGLRAIWLALLGGLFYSIGAAIDFLQSPDALCNRGYPSNQSPFRPFYRQYRLSISGRRLWLGVKHLPQTLPKKHSDQIFPGSFSGNDG